MPIGDETDYEVRIYTPSTGAPPYFLLTDVFAASAFKWGLRYRTVVDGLGSCSATLDAEDERADAFQRNGLVEIRRFAIGANEWRTEAVYVIRNLQYTRTPDSYQLLVSGYELMWMLRTVPTIPDLTVDLDGYVRKSGLADHVGKEYVRDNIGPGALADLQFPELLVEGNLPAADAGANVSKAVRWDSDGSLLDLIYTIADEGGIDFFMEFVPAVPTVSDAAIRFRSGTIGTDRTETTNAPLGLPFFVFSPARGNVIEDQFVDDWRNAITVTYALGAGKDQNQEVRRVPLAGIATGIGRWDTTVGVIRAQSAASGDTTALDNEGATNNFVNRPIRDVNFRARQITTGRYGVDYFFGDEVTYVDQRLGFTADYRIRAIEVFASRSGETVNLELLRI